jgi:hypothetical protein
MCCYGEKKAASGEEKEKTLILRHRRLSLWQGHSVTLSFFAFFCSRFIIVVCTCARLSFSFFVFRLSHLYLLKSCFFLFERHRVY